MRRGADPSSGRTKPIGRLLADERGAVMIYVTLIAAAILGVVGLAIDASRAMILRSEAQAAADAAALVAASQLDATPTAISRANQALANFVENDQRFASTGAGEVLIATVRYLVDLPDLDTAPITNDFVTTDPLRARFVEVTTAPQTHLNTFLRAVGATAPTNIARVAVAGCNQVVCRSQPMMICNPAEHGNPGAAFNINTWRGRQVRVISQNSGAIAPGNFGYLAPGGTGANVLAEALASTLGANTCYGRTVETEPGNNNGARTALNTRFGVYENPQFGGNSRNNPLYAPDVNVRIMPRDLTFSGPGNRFGSGYWNCLTYWNTNHASSGLTRPANCTANTNTWSRYQMYEWENANGRQQNPANGFANRLADRRIVYVAVVNCVEQGVNGRMDVTVGTVLKMFLTEQATGTPNVEVYAEIVDIVQVGEDDGVLIDNVQLYR